MLCWDRDGGNQWGGNGGNSGKGRKAGRFANHYDEMTIMKCASGLGMGAWVVGWGRWNGGVPSLVADSQVLSRIGICG